MNDGGGGSVCIVVECTLLTRLELEEVLKK